jgi:hypothetical protein
MAVSATVSKKTLRAATAWPGWNAIGAHVAEGHWPRNRYFKGMPSNIPVTISAKKSAATAIVACSIDFFRITGMLRS